MTVHTRGQKMAQKAFERVKERETDASNRKEYRSFAREFPTLVHQCGLAQATAFALAKKKQPLEYLKDLALVLGKKSAEELENDARTSPLDEYVRISRDALLAAVWIKRYVEALFPDDKKEVTP